MTETPPDMPLDFGLQLLALMPDGALLLKDGAVAHLNEPALVGLGYTRAADVLGRRLSELVEPLVDGTVRPRSQTGASQLVMVTHPVQFGGQRATLVVLSGGSPLRLERSRADSELRLRESQRLAKLGNWDLDLVADRVYWSDEVFRIFEIDPHTFGASYDAFLAAIHPDDRERVDEAYRHSVNQHTAYEIVHRVRSRDGRIKVVQERGRTFYAANGTAMRSIGTVQDITDRVALEEQLRLRDEAVAGSTAGIVFADLDGRLSSVNDAFVRLWGYRDASEVIGRLAIDFWAEPEKAAAALREVQTSGHAVAELIALRDDGSTFTAQVAASVARRADGTPLALMAQFFDITAQVETEQALEAREEQLRQSQKLDAVGRLAGGVAHDFNNLLTVVLSLGQSLGDMLEEGSEALELVNDILAAGERAAGLTRQLLAFARVGRAAPRVVEVNDTLRMFGRMVARLIGEDVELCLDLDTHTHPVKIDPTHLEQVLLNLAANARDAMPTGGRLRISTQPVHIGDPSAPISGPGLHLTVVDTGHGMSEEIREKAFEPFFTTKDVGRGTGLGLATVHGIVTQAGGVISVESAPGSGTTFHLYFPHAEVAATRAGPGPVAGPAGNGERILIVEDDDAVRRATSRLLTSNGYQLIEAANGEEAIAVARSDEAFDLVLSDVIMPGMHGPAVFREIARTRPHVPVIFMSGYSTDEAALERIGRLLRKPMTGAVLLGAVRTVLDERRRHRP